MRNVVSTCLLIVLYSLAHSQVVWLDPTFATQSDNVTVYYDASEGNSALVGQSIIYAHTGVVTDLSNGPTDWRHVQGNWGTADAQVEMTQVAGPIFQISFNIDQFYNVPANETVLRLAFVFRNANGSIVGRDTDGSDIFVDLYQGGFAAQIQSPTTSGIVAPTSTVDFNVLCSSAANVSLYYNGTVLKSASGVTQLDTSFVANAFGTGKHYLWYEINDQGTMYADSVYYIINDPVVVQDPPSGTEDGLNVLSNTSVILQLTAPFKDYIYAIGDFSNWELDPLFMMKQNTAGDRWWVQIDNLDPTQLYRYQFHVGPTGMRIGDVYAEMQLDPFNDAFIPNSVYPNLPDYPIGKTTDIVSVFQIDESDYQWQSTNYNRPEQTEMVIYELLVRDFLESHSYESLIDTLDYLDNLGVNAIQLMPVMEFEGNISWGYNPSFFFAPDKYYGTKEAFKSFIDACHQRDIAVLLDIAINHSFGQNPQVRMYFNPSAGQWGQPTPESPWFNETPRHDFNVGYDYNHESPYTREFTKRVIAHWVEEYRIDGYRFDLSKGFTQNNTLGSVAAWGAYDQSRVDILTDYANHLWNLDSDLALILEHFADNSEETVLSDLGFMIWGNSHFDFKEASLGYTSNLNSASYQARGWNDPHLISYYTSHDEERLVYENLQYGNSSNSNYNIKDLSIAIERMELINLFLLSTPGPKMLWQFDELGYDFPLNYCPDGSINPDCRTAPKPIRWDYAQDAERIRVYNVVAAINALRKDYPVFHTADYDYRVTGMQKSIQLNSPNHNVTVLGNFSVNSAGVNPHFQSTGWWYELFSGDSINVTDVNQSISLEPGAYRLYSDVKLETPDLDRPIAFEPISNVESVLGTSSAEVSVYPNPFSSSFNIRWEGDVQGAGTLKMFGLDGKLVHQENIYSSKNGESRIVLPAHLNRGVYIYKITLNNQIVNGRLIKVD